MNTINNMLEALKEGSGINNEYFLLIILSISIILIIKVIGKAINKIPIEINLNNLAKGGIIGGDG